MEQKSLFDRIGGSSVLQQAAQKLGNKLKSDPILSPMFKDVDIQKMNESRASYLAKLFGGPSDYKGKSLKEAHQPYDIKDGHFELFMKFFNESLQEVNVDKKLIEEAAQVVRSTKSEVLNSKTLYDRLGAENFFGKFGELLGHKILKDSLLGPKYSQTDFQKVHALRMQFFKTLFGGPGKYEGRDMKTAHSGQQLNDQHFDRFANVFEEALSELKANECLIKESMALLETLRPDVLNKQTLYEELGGEEVLTNVFKNLQEKTRGDAQIKDFWKDSDKERVAMAGKAHLMKILGGPDMYTGKNMREVHQNMKIGDKEFNIFLKHLRKAFLEGGVKEETVNKVLDVADLFRAEVVGRKSVIDRLGGKVGLHSIVQVFHENLMKDNLLGPIYGKAADPQGLVRGYSHYLAYLFGGEEPHTRGTLKNVHGKLELKDVHYDLFVDIFKETLKRFNVDEETREEAGQILEKRRNEILRRESLWKRLGGEEKMHKVCHTFEGILIKDPIVGPMHQSIDINKYHENHMDLFADLFGGYHFYSGKNLQEAHRTLKLNDDHFNLFVKLFQQALTENGISEDLVKEVKEKFEFERNEVLNRQSLYEKMGGEKTVDLVVEKLHSLIANDPVIGPMHKNVDWAKLQLNRKQYFTQLFGNLNVYQGKDLRSAHSGLNLKDEHFTMFLKLFKEAMGQVGMKPELQEQVLGMLETTRSEVLNGPSIYEKMGGKDVLMKFVERLDEISVKDAVLAKFFEKIDKKKLDEHQFQYFSNMLGGPKTNYEGKSVRQAHEQLPLSDEHFKIYMERTREALKEVGVDNNVVEETVKLFQTKRGEVLNQ